jgi:Domain of unknown function (DUF3291)
MPELRRRACRPAAPAGGRGAGLAVYELAQVNVALVRAPLDSPTMAGFIGALDPINRIAEASPGFVWRLAAGDTGSAGGAGHTAMTHLDGDAIVVVNLSVWTDYESLHAFVYRSLHGGYVKRRARWFLPATQPSTVLWWVRAGQRPRVGWALDRLRHLRAHGPSPQAFSLRRRFDPEGRPVTRER